MAFLIVNHMAESLGTNAEFYAILPETVEPPYRTVYLLHGLGDDHTRWMRQSSVERYADAMGLAVIMPNGARSFYTDMAEGRNYYTYVSRELFAYTRKMFPLSTKREDTFIAGLSMGGYGALKIAMRNPEHYAAAASLSGAVDIVNELIPKPDWQSEMKRIFGDLEKLAGSDKDLFYLVSQLNDKPLKPRLYLACGTEDHLYSANYKFRDFVKKTSFDARYEEGAGGHTWEFWDEYIKKAFAFFVER